MLAGTGSSLGCPGLFYTTGGVCVGPFSQVVRAGTGIAFLSSSSAFVRASFPATVS